MIQSTHPLLRAFLALTVLASSSVAFADESPHTSPDPKRFAKEIAKFGTDDAESPPAKGGIVFTGSSSIRLWSGLKTDFPDLPVLNRGFGGSVANDLCVYAEEIVLRYEPKVVVVYTGSNDLNAKLTVAEALADYTKFLGIIHTKLPATRVIVNSVKVSTSRIKQVGLVKELNTALEAWAKDNPWVTWVEATSHLMDKDGRIRDEIFRTDHLHLNADGYAEWKKILEPVLRRVWGEELHG
jgi:lysophospholipase L1-like esterase